jgi:hypothetical protein
MLSCRTVNRRQERRQNFRYGKMDARGPSRSRGRYQGNICTNNSACLTSGHRTLAPCLRQSQHKKGDEAAGYTRAGAKNFKLCARRWDGAAQRRAPKNIGSIRRSKCSCLILVPRQNFIYPMSRKLK